MKSFIILSLLAMSSLVRCSKNDKVCITLRALKKQCYTQGDQLAFAQTHRVMGNTVADFVRYPLDTIQITCFTASGLEIDDFPQLDLSDVTKINMTCSLPDPEVLSVVKRKLNLQNVKHLTLNNDVPSPTGRLTRNLLRTFTRLETLKIRIRANTTVDGDIFQPLKYLKELDIEVHDVTDLPSGVFTYLFELVSLRIEDYGSQPRELDASTLNFTLKNCINLAFFHLSGVKLPLNVNKLDNKNTLEAVEIVNNNIVSLSNQTFGGLKQIVSLNLRNNSLKCIDEDTFNQQTSMEKLDLSHNKLEALHEDIFRENYFLLEIDLSYNRLKYLNW